MGPTEQRCVDEDGRVTIPTEIRESLGIESGEEVTVELEGDRIVIRPHISRETFAETLEGCINEETRATDAEPHDPIDLKADWTDDLPE